MPRGSVIRFPTTHWSLVARAGHGNAAGQAEALDELLNRYVGPLRIYLVRGRHIESDRADDLLQGFICDKVLKQHLIRRADRNRGRFRTFLLRALSGYVADAARTSGAQKRGVDRSASLGVRHEPADRRAQPDEAFQISWAQQVLDEALESMREECEQSKRPDLWAIFEMRVLGPTMRAERPPAYKEMVERFGFRSPVQASNSVITAKRMFARHLWAIIGCYEKEPEEIERELAELKAILAMTGR